MKTAGRGVCPSRPSHRYFFIVFFAGFFPPIFMDIIFFIFLNCSSVKMVRISFMAFNISR